MDVKAKGLALPVVADAHMTALRRTLESPFVRFFSDGRDCILVAGYAHTCKMRATITATV